MTHVFQTIGEPPSTGRSILATIGSTRNIRNALRNSVAPKSGTTTTAGTRSARAPVTPADTFSGITRLPGCNRYTVLMHEFRARVTSLVCRRPQNRDWDYESGANCALYG